MYLSVDFDRYEGNNPNVTGTTVRLKETQLNINSETDR